MLALNCDLSHDVVLLALLNVRSDLALIAKAESTLMASCDRAGKIRRYVGWAHHLITVVCLPSRVSSRLGRAEIKALKLYSLSATTADCCCYRLKADNSAAEVS